MNYRSFLLTFLISLFVVQVFSQASFEKTYGGVFHETSNSILQTEDDGFLLCGYTTSYGTGLEDVYVVKTDAQGNPEWEKTYGGYGDDHGYYITETNDGDYIICGESTSFSPRRAYVLKINSVGDTLWTNTYVHPGYWMSIARHILPTPDNGFLICGATGTTNIGQTDAFLFKVNENGQLQWSNTYGGEDYDSFFSMCFTTDGGCLLVGSTSSFGVENFDLYMIRTDSAGDTLWTKTYGGPGYDGGYSVHQLDDNSFIVGAESPNFGSDIMNMAVLNIDNSGNIIWSSTVGEEIGYFRCFLTLTSDNCIAGCGWNNDYYSSTIDLVMFKMNLEGELMWSQKYGGENEEWGLGIVETSDLGYAVTGTTFSYGAGMSDMYFIKTNAEGVITSLPHSQNEKNLNPVYPNPGRDKITIYTNGKNATFTLFNLEGNKVYTEDINERNESICVPGIPEGIYIYKLINTNGELINTGKWVKN